MVDILIPTYKNYQEITSQVEEIYDNTLRLEMLIASCKIQSAAKNRNLCHRYARSDYIIMLDDDIRGFYSNWEQELILPLKQDKEIKFVSARLIKEDGSWAGMMTSKHQVQEEIERVPRIPTACFAYRKEEMDSLIQFHNDTSLPFDEKFEGSGWEDNAICHDLYKKFPTAKIIINNKCKLVHLNEEKEQKKHLKKNREYFFSTRNENEN